MILAVFIVDGGGAILAEKHSVGTVGQDVVLRWHDGVRERGEGWLCTAPISVPPYYCVWYSEADVFLVAVLDEPSQAVVAQTYLARFAEILAIWLDQPVSAHGVRHEFAMVLQLLEETIDSGVPINTEPCVLARLVKPHVRLESGIKTFRNKLLARGPKDDDTFALESSTPWRPPAVYHSSNKLYIDCLERVTGSTVRPFVSGTINCIFKYAGSSKVKATFAPGKRVLGLQLHECVDLMHYEREGELLFVPPDNHFLLASYVGTCNHLSLVEASFDAKTGCVDMEVHGKLTDFIIRVAAPRLCEVGSVAGAKGVTHVVEGGGLFGPTVEFHVGDVQLPCRLQCIVRRVDLSPVASVHCVPAIALSGSSIRDASLTGAKVARVSVEDVPKMEKLVRYVAVFENTAVCCQ